MSTQTLIKPASSKPANPQAKISIFQLRQILIIEKAEDYYFHTLPKSGAAEYFVQPPLQLGLSFK